MKNADIEQQVATIVFQPYGRTVQVPVGATVREAASLAGIALEYPCGGQGTCGKCRVKVAGNDSKATPTETTVLSKEELQAGFRLACQMRIENDARIEIPESSLSLGEYQILAGRVGVATTAADPPVRAVRISLPQPTLADDRPDAERLLEAVHADSVTPALLYELPSLLRDSGFEGTAVVASGHVIDFVGGQEEAPCFAAAFDLGTTTVVGELFDVRTGRTPGTVSRMNPQTAFGDDVLSRIAHASGSSEALQEIHGAVIAAINEMLAEMADQAGIRIGDIYEITVSGNTTMEHLFAGLNPQALGMVPFVPVARHSLTLDAERLGLNINPRGTVYVLPVIGGFVGGDTVAGIAATHIETSVGPSLFIDIGTNGELALIHDGKLSATSCAAGPALEGARISCGMRAAAGAIEALTLDDDVGITTIGGGAPVGLCGSGLIDLAAELLRKGILTSKGSFVRGEALPDTLPPALRDRVIEHEGGIGFLFARAGETRSGQPLVLTQRDVRELQLAVGAIRAGISILLKRVHLEPGQLDRVYVAGGFGNYVRLSNAQRIGLLPESLREEQFHFAGNTSLEGARAAAFSLGERARAEAISRAVAHFDLSCDAEFQTEFAMAMFFPEIVEENSEA
ncbi:MAG: ASKHA domain-containing protein [Candidatus Hydrogenedentota bacterium]